MFFDGIRLVQCNSVVLLGQNNRGRFTRDKISIGGKTLPEAHCVHCSYQFAFLGRCNRTNISLILIVVAPALSKLNICSAQNLLASITLAKLSKCLLIVCLMNVQARPTDIGFGERINK